MSSTLEPSAVDSSVSNHKEHKTTTFITQYHITAEGSQGEVGSKFPEVAMNNHEIKKRKKEKKKKFLPPES